MADKDYCSKKISIIVPVFNTEDYFDRCIKSLLHQSFFNIEIIVVNDGSKGDIRDRIQRYLEEDERIRFIDNKKNQGLFRARVCGAEAATGDYIAFLDSDDHVSYDFYRTLVQKACETKADITIGKTVWERSDGSRFVYNLHESCFSFDLIKGPEVQSAYFKQEASCYSWHTIWNKIYNMDLWRKCKDFFKTVNEHIVMTEDILFSTVLFYNAASISTVKNDAYFYCINDGASTNVVNMTAKRFEKNIADMNSVFNYCCDYLTENNASNEILTHFNKARLYYSRIWKHFYDCDFKVSEKRRISKATKGFWAEIGDEEVPSFYFESVVTEWNGGLEYIKEQIGKGNEKAISFDVFDTLIARKLYEPTDLLDLLDDTYIKQTGTVSSFAFFRREAEDSARKNARQFDSGCEDVTLHEIYEHIYKKYGISNGILKKLEDRERSLERKLCFARNSGKELFDLALYTGKRIYLISDMYLEKSEIEQILAINGYSGYQELFVSSQCGKLKATGNLYRFFMKQTCLAPSEILHIGDNWISDIRTAQKLGIKTHFLPKAREASENIIATNKVNRCTDIGMELVAGFMDIDQMKQSMGCRIMRALAFNYYFDNPYRTFNHESDLNIDPYFIGYATLGMHVLGICKWIANYCNSNSVDTIHFCARDGAVILEAYKLMSEAGLLPGMKLNYLQASRKALLPAIVRSRQDFYQLPVEYRGQTPQSLLKLIGFASLDVTEGDTSKIEKYIGIKKVQHFETRAQFEKFIDYFLDHLYSKQKHDASLNELKEYYSQVKDNDVVFDMGYSGRIIEAMAYCCGHPVNSLYIHENYAVSDRVKLSGVISIQDFYDFMPLVSGLIREEMISEPVGSCIGFERQGKDIISIVEEDTRAYQDVYPIKSIQSGAIALIKDFIAVCGLIGRMPEYSTTAVSIPFEGFLRTASYKDRQVFGASIFEDEVYGGAKSINVTEFFNDQLSSMNDESRYNNALAERDTFMEIIHKSSKLKRAILYILVDRKMFVTKFRKNIASTLGSPRKSQ